MSTALLAFIAVIICLLFRILNVNSQPQKPGIWCCSNKFLEHILKSAPLLQDPYIPTRLWGFSGHVQTIIHNIIGRVKCPWPIGERVYLVLADQTTLTYDLYQPIEKKRADDVTVAICPGIGNTSESVYIRTIVHWCQIHGFRACVLNHLGALHSVPVTSPRIFSYGNTSDYKEMIYSVLERHSNTKLVCVGFSLGGNIVTKYLGEKDKPRPTNIIGGISICQGYCAVEGSKWLLNWQNFRRFYLYVMTENMKNIILRHRHILLNEESKTKWRLNERDIISAATLPELDDAYTKKVHGFSTINDLYRWSSCKYYLENIETPMIFINAKDDPIIHPDLLEPMKNFAATHKDVIYLESANGGHLGFYEGGFIYPNPVTWLDRALVFLLEGFVYHYNESVQKKEVQSPTDENTLYESILLPMINSSKDEILKANGILEQVGMEKNLGIFDISINVETLSEPTVLQNEPTNA